MFGFPVEQAMIGECDLSVVFVGGEWQWLVMCRGREVAEGGAGVIWRRGARPNRRLPVSTCCVPRGLGGPRAFYIIPVMQLLPLKEIRNMVRALVNAFRPLQ